MSKYTVTIDVADFAAAGSVPPLAFATFARAVADQTTGEIVTTSPVSVRLTQTPAMVQLEANVAYRVQLDGVAGASGVFYVLHYASCSFAELRRDHQIDPSTLAPIVNPPASVAELLAQVRALLGGAGGALSGDYPNPGFNTTALDQAVAARVRASTSETATALAATYVTYDGTNLRKNGTVIPISGGGTSGVAQDTDGVYYPSSTGTKPIVADSDGVYYPAA